MDIWLHRVSGAQHIFPTQTSMTTQTLLDTCCPLLLFGARTSLRLGVNVAALRMTHPNYRRSHRVWGVEQIDYFKGTVRCRVFDNLRQPHYTYAPAGFTDEDLDYDRIGLNWLRQSVVAIDQGNTHLLRV